MGRWCARKRSGTSEPEATAVNPVSAVVLSAPDSYALVEWEQSSYGESAWYVYDVADPGTPLLTSSDMGGPGHMVQAGGSSFTPGHSYVARVTFTGFEPVFSSEYLYNP
jgi:hypothetical protein